MDLVLLSLKKSLNGNVYDFSVDYNSIDNSGILNIYKYLINKNNIRKNVFACLFSVHNTISLSRHEQVCLLYF